MEQTKKLVDVESLSVEELKAILSKKEASKDKDRQAYKDLVQETVPKAIFRLTQASEHLSNAKTDTFKFFEQVLDLKNKVYGLKQKQQSHTFSTDREEITIGYRINEGWDDTVSAGVEKVQRFIQSLAKDENSAALVDTVFNLLKKDAKGNLKGSRVLELQKLAPKFNDEEFSNGVKIIAEAYKPVRSSWFIEAYLINADGSKTSIPLSMSSAGFSAGYEFDFFAEEIPEQQSSES